MKLKDCTHGKIVIDIFGHVGMIVGIQYDSGVKFTGNMDEEELRNRTISTVQFPDGTRGVHPANLQEYKGI